MIWRLTWPAMVRPALLSAAASGRPNSEAPSSISADSSNPARTRADIVSGFPVRQIIVWARAGGINFNPGYFLPDYEVVYLIAKPDFRLAPKANATGCVWRIGQETGNPHPAPFPVELATRCIESVGGGPVLDPFMGSGTTAIAAENLGIDWTGIEKSAEYVALAEERIGRVIGRSS